MQERTCLKKYPSQVTTAHVIHNSVRGDITLVVTKQDDEGVKPSLKFTQRLQKWNMKDIRSSSSNRQPLLNDEEQMLFAQALDTKEGKEAINELKNSTVNEETDKVIDFITDKVLKPTAFKQSFAKLKEEKLAEFGTKSARSLSINVRQMFDHLVLKGIIKIQESIKA